MKRIMGRRTPLLAGVAAAVAVIVALLAAGLGRDPSVITSPLVGRMAPNFTLSQLDGPPVTLAKLRGQVVIINFWASWCEPCQRETPLIASWYKQQHGHVIVVGLDVNDSAAKALQFARAKGVSYPLGVDPALAAANAYGVVVLPQTFFLNAQHRIVDRVFGGVTQADLAKGVRLMDAPGS